MSAGRLHELMEERVAAVDVPDLAGAAWVRAGRVRRRRRSALVGVVAATVLAVVGTLAWTGRDGPSGPLPSGRPTRPMQPAPTPPEGDPRATLAGELRGAPFWWAPAAGLDARLPVLQVPGLPERLSLDVPDPVTTPPDHVDAVFAMGKQVYLMLSDGASTAVDLSDRLGPVADDGGNAYSPLSTGSVSPDGTQVFFRQPGRVEVWDLPADTWRSVEAADAESTTWTLDGRLAWGGGGGRPDPWDRGDHAYAVPVAGPEGRAAELDWMAEGVSAPTASEPGQYANPQFLAAGTPDAVELLAFGEGRNKMCCLPMAWFSHDFVLFSASSPDGRYRVLAWRVGTPDLYRVSEYVDLPPRIFSASWAEGAFR